MRFGPSCWLSCSSSCQDALCHHVSGDCLSCPPGKRGKRCDKNCVRGRFGLGCDGNCSTNCQGGVKICSPVDGFCTKGCAPGYVPPLCVNECPMSTYGINCAQRCNVTCTGQSCHYQTGVCESCVPGWLGDFCELECPFGTYGLGCKESCSDNCEGGLGNCSTTDGVCKQGCLAGYQPPFCVDKTHYTYILWNKFFERIRDRIFHKKCGNMLRQIKFLRLEMSPRRYLTCSFVVPAKVRREVPLDDQNCGTILAAKQIHSAFG
ncbi:multiple epidermal growth factor-like domains 10 [Plakobranchus ocellatus]|uniref:Multiple epidermal growth factor-like domains 10 n=1 Tax=Plakobranchus ocellatus TaxID=259542 RepID=A0AAV4B9R8_9GAST|nr:multiple epidermal growth factor-like domains 10 [Plakobranchus ocellatus]